MDNLVIPISFDAWLGDMLGISSSDALPGCLACDELVWDGLLIIRNGVVVGLCERHIIKLDQWGLR